MLTTSSASERVRNHRMALAMPDLDLIKQAEQGAQQGVFGGKIRRQTHGTIALRLSPDSPAACGERVGVRAVLATARRPQVGQEARPSPGSRAARGFRPLPASGAR